MFGDVYHQTRCPSRGTLSPFLYSIFVDELLDELTSFGFGGAIQTVYCGAPMYADDLSLVSDSPDSLQAMLDIDGDMKKWKFYFLHEINL